MYATRRATICVFATSISTTTLPTAIYRGPLGPVAFCVHRVSIYANVEIELCASIGTNSRVGEKHTNWCVYKQSYPLFSSDRRTNSHCSI